MRTTEYTRQGSGTPRGGQFASKPNTAPSHALSGQSLVRATAGPVQVVYDRDTNLDRVRITVLLRDAARSEREGAEAWVEEGAALTDTPASSSGDRMNSVAASQVSRLASAIDRGADQHETIDAFLAEVADRRDPLITRGTRRRHGEELEDAPWPDLDDGV